MSTISISKDEFEKKYRKMGVKRLAEYLGVSKATIVNYVNKLGIKHIRKKIIIT